MDDQSTIRAFQQVLSKFTFKEASSFSEDFAQKRFLKKFQVPDSSKVDDLKSSCWNSWIINDDSLPRLRSVPRKWYIAREFLHRNLGTPSFERIQFPSGSEFTPTLGRNSLEAKLSSSDWTTTYDNFGSFARICYNHMGLKRAVRRRYNRWFANRGFDLTRSQSDKYLYQRFKSLGTGDVGFTIFSWKLSQIVTFTQGSRFSTVPKNNEKRRPINIEPFGNILSQKCLGNWIREQIFDHYGHDLNTLADEHRVRIRAVSDISTIDLKDASDSISLDLCRFLLPKRLMKRIEETRSPFVLGHDNNYHDIKKVSSMGNGFTFELMSLILTSICKVLDPGSSVFGDDIIIATEKAEELMDLLTAVGLKVNFEKSFTFGPFRESCGANFHLDEGYVESYDFKYPESIGDCVMIWNKVHRLSAIYPSFRSMQQSLYRVLPKALHGGPCREFQECETLDLIGHKGFRTTDPRVTFPLFFVTKGAESAFELSDNIKQKLKDYHYDPREFKAVPGFEFKSDLRTNTLKRLHPSRNWAKYLMYLDSGMRVKDAYSLRGRWVRVWFVSSGSRTFRAKNLAA